MPEDYDMVVFVRQRGAPVPGPADRARGGFSWPPAVIAATVGPASAQGLRELPGFGANTTVRIRREAQSLAPLKRRAEAGLPATWLITSGRAPTPRSPICGPPACKPGGKAAVSC